MQRLITDEPLFDGRFFQGNRRTLLERLDAPGVVVLAAHTMIQRNRDNSYPFRQESTFWYMAGVSEPDVAVAFDEHEAFLIKPTGRHQAHEAFEGSIDNAALTEQSGGLEVLDHQTGWRRLKSLAAKHGIVYTPQTSASYIRALGLQTNSGPSRLRTSLKRRLPGSVTYQDIRADLSVLRVVKQPAELATIRRAIEVTTEAFSALNNETLDNEAGVAARLRYEFARRGADEAYPSIVAGGKNACTLHYRQNNQAIEPAGFLLIDAGAEVSLYAADITRTFAVDESRTSGRALEVRAAVASLQQRAIELFMPGRSLNNIEKSFESMMMEALKDLGLTANQQDHRLLRQYYPHRLSHYLGLDVHDVGDYDAPLEPGMVMTVEPGIYIPEEGIGVRIEDDILITDDGCEVLSADCPQSVLSD